MPKLGIGSYTYGWALEFAKSGQGGAFGVMDILREAVRHNVKVVQIGDNAPLHALGEANLAEFKAASDKNDISLEVGTRGLKPEVLDVYIPLARRMESRILRMVIDQDEYEPSEPEVIAVIRSYLPKLQKNGVVLAIENHDRFPVKSLARIMESVGSEHVGICLDTVNSIGAAEGTETVVDSLAPYTVNLHVKDFAIARLPHLMGFTVTGRPAGQGMLNVPWLLEKLDKHNRKVNAILELWTTPESKPEDTLAKEQRWTDESLDYLRSCIKD